MKKKKKLISLELKRRDLKKKRIYSFSVLLNLKYSTLELFFIELN